MVGRLQPQGTKEQPAQRAEKCPFSNESTYDLKWLKILDDLWLDADL
jgi:hypothetical protein